MDNNSLKNKIDKGIIHDTSYDIKSTDPMPGYEAFRGKKTGDEFSFENGIKNKIIHADEDANFSFSIYHRKDALNVDNNSLINQSKFTTGHFFMENTNL